MTLTLTGLRRSELVGLRWRHVNLVEGTLRVVESKSEEGERLIALPVSLIDQLVKQYAKTPFKADDDFVFAHPERGTRLGAKWYHGEFQAALTVAGVEGRIRTFHDMRHTAIGEPRGDRGEPCSGDDDRRTPLDVHDEGLPPSRRCRVPR